MSVMMVMMVMMKGNLNSWLNIISPNINRGHEVITSLEPTAGMRSLNKSTEEKVQTKFLEETRSEWKAEGELISHLLCTYSALLCPTFVIPSLYSRRSIWNEPAKVKNTTELFHVRRDLLT